VAERIDDEFLVFAGSADQLAATIRASKADRQSKKSTIDEVRRIVAEWFRTIRIALVNAGIPEADLVSVDALMQDLLRLAQGRSSSATYLTLLRRIKTVLANLEVARTVATVPMADVSVVTDVRPTEVRIIQMLDDLVPSAAMSYRQAIRDLSDPDRQSYRGTTNELRSAVWDVLDRLAPDADVMSAPGFKLENNRDKPTQKQKTRHILKSRLGDNARKAPETSVQLIEDHVGSLSRAVYDRTSISAHLAASRSEVSQLRMYVETLLAELLEIHF
jgi:Predicted pPIWI-associating nuclease